MESALAGLGLLLAFATWTVYLAAVPKEKVPARPMAHVASMLLAGLLALASLARPWLAGERFAWPVALVAAVALVLAGFFIYLLSLARLPGGGLCLRPGDRLLPFTARDDAGNLFSSETWQGRRLLLKFFRGSW